MTRCIKCGAPARVDPWSVVPRCPTHFRRRVIAELFAVALVGAIIIGALVIVRVTQ